MKMEFHYINKTGELGQWPYGIMSHCGIDGEEVMEIRTNTESCIAVITVRGRSPSAVMTSNTARGVSSYFHYFRAIYSAVTLLYNGLE